MVIYVQVARYTVTWKLGTIRITMVMAVNVESIADVQRRLKNWRELQNVQNDTHILLNIKKN